MVKVSKVKVSKSKVSKAKVSKAKVSKAKVKFPIYKIQNVVVSANLFKEIPLEKLARRLPNTEYNPEQFPGLVLRLNEEKGKRVTALIFSSGKIVCTGTKGENEVGKAIKNVIKELNKAKIKITTQKGSLILKGL